jgi:hypothetical protein
MHRRFGAAIFTAVLLHAALIGLRVLSRHAKAPHVPDTNVASAPELALIMIMADDGPSSVCSDGTSSIDEPSDRAVQRQARFGQSHAPAAQRSASAPDAEAEVDQAGALDTDAALAELGLGAEAESSLEGAAEAPSPARQRVDLGLDGSVMRHAALEGRERAPRRRRPVFTLDHWSESVVRSVAQTSAPWEGRALLTLEWDSTGQLRSVTPSAASSGSDEWQRLAKRLTSQLAARPNVAAQGGGLRLVYLVKSDLVLPESKRSLLPGARYASAEQLREKNLPPATAINLGVKADASAATTRVVSVTLVRSDAP